MEMTLVEQMRRFKLDLGGKLLQAGQILESEMHRVVAIDTGDLDESIETGNVKIGPGTMSVDIGADMESYAGKVEFGEGIVYNYHRRSGASRPVVFTGDGMHFTERSIKEKETEIISKLLSAKIL